MRLAFLGTPEAAVPTLEALVDAGHEVVVVISQPDRRRGRGADVSASPVKAAARAQGLRVAEDLGVLGEVEVDYGIVVAYGEIIPAAILERTPLLNVHFSLLPRWRGAAPVERAILAGDVETGVGVISLEATLDTGPLHGEARTLVDDKTSGELTAELAVMGAELLVRVLDDPEALARPRPQEGESTYAAKVNSETFHLSPAMSVEYARRVVRLERAFARIDGRRLRVLRAGAGAWALPPGRVGAVGESVGLGVADGTLELVYVQPEGSRTMSGAAWWAGARLTPGVEWE
jgi:methionyl-tRNA formyltransferase